MSTIVVYSYEKLCRLVSESGRVCPRRRPRLSPSIKERYNHVNFDYSRKIFLHSPLSPYTTYRRLNSVVAPFLQLALTASRDDIHLLYRVFATRSSAGRSKVYTLEGIKNGVVFLNHLHMHQGSSLLFIFSALSHIFQCHPSAAQLVTFTSSTQLNISTCTLVFSTIDFQ